MYMLDNHWRLDSIEYCLLLKRVIELLSTLISTLKDFRTPCFFRFCPRSLLSLDPDLIDKIPGRQNDRKTPLGELNWIFTAITDTIAWNVLPRGEKFRILWLEVQYYLRTRSWAITLVLKFKEVKAAELKV